MKNKLLFLIIAPFVFINCFAQAPQGIPYQGLARNANETVISNQPISVRFTILNGAPNGTVVYTETHSTTTDSNGLFSLVVGQGTAQNGTIFSNVNWAIGSKFLKDEIDTGSGYVLLGTTQMMSVPYALYAANSGSAGNNSTIIPFASGTTLRVAKEVNAYPGPLVSVIGFGNSQEVRAFGGGQIDMNRSPGNTPGINYAFAMPVDGTISDITANLNIVSGVSVPTPYTLTIIARVYKASVNSNEFLLIPGAIVFLSPALSGDISEHTILSGIATGLNIPVIAQTKIMLVYTAILNGSPDIFYSVTGYASAGINIRH